MEKQRARSDLEERTLRFAHDVRVFVKKVPTGIANREDAAQLVRSSGSVGANYIEAQEALSRKDFALRVKISRKEAKESRYWLRLIDIPASLADEREQLLQEALELLKIFSAIVQKL